MTAPKTDFEWHPAKLLRDDHGFALLALNQRLENGPLLRRLWHNAITRVAADGGANQLLRLSSDNNEFSELQAIVGDLDSLETSARTFYTSKPNPAQIVHITDQESTDFGKSINWIRKSQAHAVDIVVLGGLGGRVDQGVSNLHHLYFFQSDPGYAKGRIYLLSEMSLTFVLKSGSHSIHVRQDGKDDVFGKHVGILPLRGKTRISTKGLEWDVTDWECQMGLIVSTSNHILPETRCVEIQTDTDVLFTIALRAAGEEETGDEERRRGQ